MENSTTIYNSSSSTSSSAAALSLMENYPTIFNTSSSTSSASPFTLNMMMDSHTSLTETHDKKPNGFLGLMTQMTMQVPRSSSTSSELFGKNNIISHATKSFADGVQTDHHEVQKDQKMKGEKKIKKSRYAFQTRSQVDILDDGYKWRKYGQKSVKNNNFPRSYYRCTHQGCNVKKQVQRLSKDEGIVVTTYEGMHSHPIEKSTDNFEHILNEMQIYTSS